mmetsp:Transcript_20931/g.30165  ORF Transcript_20931/g.30165 Transcript_20931/m.30165 type:complete len:593 (-) Transcript_20931:87-1865(-)
MSSLARSFRKRMTDAFESPDSKSRKLHTDDDCHDPRKTINKPSAFPLSPYHSCGSAAQPKYFADIVHKQIKLEPLCVRIVDTLEYQRLSSLKQLGTCNYVFRGATHSRFEHSIGVAYLAERMARGLMESQPELNITEIDVLCVKVAGLCHDLGHGPFSHVFDGVFIRRMYPNGLDGNGTKWRHEDGSVKMFRHLLKENNIDVSKYGIGPQDLIFIEEIINGTVESERNGRDPLKFFLYDIVNNSRSGLDVDKLDYFQRDAMMTGVSSNVDFDRFFQLARVVPAQPINPGVDLLSPDSDYPLMICYPQKMVSEAVGLFATRFNMHKQVYTHQAVKQVEFMITDALELADPYITIRGNPSDRFPKGEYRISEAVFDMRALSNLNDTILDVILSSTDKRLEPAQALIHRVLRRQLYRCVGKTTIDADDDCSDKSEADILQEIIACSHRVDGGMFNGELIDSQGEDIQPLPYDDNTNLGHEDSGGFVVLEEKDLIVEKMHIHHGMKNLNPVSRLRFFPKALTLPGSTLRSRHSGPVARQLDERVYQTQLPRVFEDKSIRLFCRAPEKEAAAVQAFEKWCSERNSHLPFPSLSQPDN